MPIAYTISTVDSVDYKRLICGRTDDITKLLDHVSQGHSIALFGERRIGKTSLLFMLRDLINGPINQYQPELIDRTLKHAVANLQAKVTNCKAVYIDLHALDGIEHKAFVQLLHQRITEMLGDLAPPNPGAEPPALVDMLTTIQSALQGQRLIILIDEIEVLLELPNVEKLWRNLRSVIQACPHICFVFAGAEAWHKQIKDKTSPLVNNVQVFYLKEAAQFPTETYLIAEPLSEYFQRDDDLENLVRTIVEWTECKPWYVQAVCQIIVEVCIREGELPRDWKTSVQTKVYEAVGPTLDAFYAGEALDEISRKILALLASKPKLTVKELASRLNYSPKIIWDRIVDLEALDKVRGQGSEYRIVGTLIEEWGKKTQDIPATRNPWPQRLKWVGALISLAIAAIIYFYTNPSLEDHSFALPSGLVSVRLPSSLEDNEIGNVRLTIQNTSPGNVYSITLALSSSDTDYQLDGTNRFVFETVKPGEVRFKDPIFTVHKSGLGQAFTSQILVSQDPGGFSTIYSFNVSRRDVPIKNYWGFLNIVLIALSAFFTKQDLVQLITSVFSKLPGSHDRG